MVFENLERTLKKITVVESLASLMQNLEKWWMNDDSRLLSLKKFRGLIYYRKNVGHAHNPNRSLNN